MTKFLYETSSSVWGETIDICLRHQQENTYGLSQQDTSMEHPL